MDFGEGQKPVALGPVIHEGGLKAGLNVGNYSLVEVSDNFAAGCGFYEEISRVWPSTTAIRNSSGWIALIIMV